MHILVKNTGNAPSKITSIHYFVFSSFLATTLQPPLPTESSAEYNGDREYFHKFFLAYSEQTKFEVTKGGMFYYFVIYSN